MKNKKVLRSKKIETTKGKVCLAWNIYTFPVLDTHNKMFIFLTNDKPVIKIVRYIIIFLSLVLVKKYVPHVY